MPVEQLERHHGTNDPYKRQLQHEIKTYLTRYYKMNLGQGIEDLKITILEDMIIIRSRGILTKTEKYINNAPGSNEIIKNFRRHIMEKHGLDQIPYYEQLLSARVVQQAMEIDPEQDIAVQVIIFDHIIGNK